MTNKLPITLLAQLDDVAVFQTAAFSSIAADALSEKHQQTQQRKQASYGELNLGLHVNDDAAQVLTNRMRLLTAINEQLAAPQQNSSTNSLPIRSLHWVNQIHGKKIHDIDATALSMEPMAADVMLSQQVALGLAIMTADCVPIVLYQPTTGQIAAIHAGWQGLACGVIKATAERFSDSGQILAWIGVCISQYNYEVGRDVRDKLLAGCIKNQSLTIDGINHFDERYVMSAVINADADLDVQRLHKTVDKLSSYAKVDAEKIKINLPRLAADQLQAAGITVCNSSSIPCSYADDRYYSYRRQTHLQQPATGRMALIITRSASI
ncbi:polyphenol oxidase family protein [Psychrobacter sp. DAB_AL32B]|uniref:polyphenol oxidase family protein n=1 Tax=Psychrobacter sp. DAB_AL32B TaxID=1028414 RepID=UPI000B801D38|nr:polyphenol oxidase family protein [Psychrobacter sp. DAB_AL32B]OXL26856.1 multicopper polyphenol oxidase [Psychrobacter sp. DAB_AL32B]